MQRVIDQIKHEMGHASSKDKLEIFRVEDNQEARRDASTPDPDTHEGEAILGSTDEISLKQPKTPSPKSFKNCHDLMRSGGRSKAQRRISPSASCSMAEKCHSPSSIPLVFRMQPSRQLLTAHDNSPSKTIGGPSSPQRPYNSPVAITSPAKDHASSTDHDQGTCSGALGGKSNACPEPGQKSPLTGRYNKRACELCLDRGCWRCRGRDKSK